MLIQNTQSKYITKQQNKNISHKGAREFVRTIANPDALTSTVLLETSVTGGRGYNAYKRGGVNELRERAVDDIVSAVFWMKGVDIFNKIGDKLGKKFLKLPTTEFDVGKDALRTPFNNLVENLPQMNVKSDDLKKMEKKLATFKFSKIILSTILSTAFVGFALPRINQAITRTLMNKDKIAKTNKAASEAINLKYSQVASVSIDEFNKKFDNNEKPSFKGVSSNTITTVAHYLENNKVCKLLSSDVGITTGRVTSARNKDEGIEYLFRDCASSFFYMASTPLIYSGLQKLTKSSGYTSIDPVAAKQVNELLTAQLGENASMGIKEFAAKTIGLLDDKAKDLLDNLPFNSDVISLKEFTKHLDNEALISKAQEMAKLQPKQAGVGAVLTRQQAADVLKSGAINNPEFMQKIFGSKFGDALTNEYKFIPMKKITSFRDDIDNYVQSVIEMAKKNNNGIVDKKLLDKLNKKSFVMSAGFRAIAIGISALALGFAIPKLQYAITKKRTGKNEAPGLREFETSDSKKVSA